MEISSEASINFKTIESWDKKEVEKALKIISKDPKQKAAAEKRYGELITFIGGKNLSALKTAPAKLNTHRYLTSEWDPSPEMRVILAGIPIKEINIKGKNIPEIPSWIGHLALLKSFRIETSKVKIVPESFGNLKSLETLYLTDNQITTLPESLGNLTNLKQVALFKNSLTGLPESFSKLKALKKLNLVNNKIENFPRAILGMESLVTLALGSNLLVDIPDDLDKLKNLEELYLSNNKLKSFPEVLGMLPKVRLLSLASSSAKELPRSIMNMETLRNLRLDSNFELKLPTEDVNLPNLERFSGSYLKRIESIPDFLFDCPNLKSLTLNYTDLRNMTPDAFDWKHLEEFSVLDTPIAEQHKLETIIKGSNEVRHFIQQVLDYTGK